MTTTPPVRDDVAVTDDDDTISLSPEYIAARDAQVAAVGNVEATEAQAPAAATPEMAPGNVTRINDNIYRLDDLIATYAQLLSNSNERIAEQINSSLFRNVDEIAQRLASSQELRQRLCGQMRSEERHNADLTNAAVRGLLESEAVTHSFMSNIRNSLAREISDTVQDLLRNSTENIRQQIQTHIERTYTERIAEMEVTINPLQQMLRTTFGAEMANLRNNEAANVLAAQARDRIRLEQQPRRIDGQ